MNLGRYRLDRQLGAGRDGTAYAAVDDDSGQPFEVRVLAAAQAEPARWAALQKRLHHAALIPKSSARRDFTMHLQESPPFVALEAGETLEAGISPSRPLPSLRDVAVALAGALAEAHRVGFVHGGIRPSVLRFSAGGNIVLDFTNIDCESAVDEPSFRAPELATEPADAAADVFALSQVLSWLGRDPAISADGQPDAGAAPLDRLMARMMARDPSQRPSAADILGELQLASAPSLEQSEVTQISATNPRQEAQILAGTTLGRFRLLELVGEGGLGQVYRAEDVADGAIVAVKVLHKHLTQRGTVLKRFEKEARLLGEIRNPYVANLIEVNADAGVNYLALEFIDGLSLSRLLRDPDVSPHNRWEEGPALALAIGVARALADAHRRGIIHRDIKPQNIMILRDSWLQRWVEELARGAAVHERLKEMPAVLGTKLCDFGLARHVDQSDSLHVTHEGTLLGTPLYMSPEQALGALNLGPATDVYALGATLFHVLAGKPPFQAETALALSMKHAKEPPPPLQSLNPRVSDGMTRIVERCLAKKPEDRYADAGDLLDELERLARGDPARLALHPRLPAPTGAVLQYDWTWELSATPEQLWPYVSNTERLNHAAGLPAVDFHSEAGAVDQGSKRPGAAANSKQVPPGQGVLPPLRRFGMFKVAGVTNSWQEHPFEWIEGRRLGVLREYSAGVFRWLASTVELEARPGGGCKLTHRVRLEPRHWFGRWIAAFEVGLKARRHLEKVYRRIDTYLTGQLSGVDAYDPFQPPVSLSRSQRQRLERYMDRLAALHVAPQVTLALTDYLLHAPEQELARLRPLALARQLEVADDDMLAACLHGVHEGLFVLLWDLICPICRIPSGIVETLQALQDHGHCEACQADFQLDFANSVELIFRVHPHIRPVETRTYCVGGPAHSPHVAAQVRVAAGECLELDLTLAEGAYCLRGPQLPHALEFWVETQAPLSRWTLRLPNDLAVSPEDTTPGALRLRAGRQRIKIDNQHSTELVLRVERRANRLDALTAARATTSPLFRELFPGEVLQAGRLVSVAAVTFLAADLGQISNLDVPANLYKVLDEPRVFALLHEHCVLGEECLRHHGGAVIKTLGETVLAVFDDEAAALRGALAWHQRLARELRPHWPAENLRLRLGLHRGAALAATINGRLDYFGATVDQALRLPTLGEPDQLLMTRDLAADPHFLQQVRSLGLTTHISSAELPGQAFGLLLAAALPAAGEFPR